MDQSSRRRTRGLGGPRFRRRGSVIGPPLGTEAGAGYNSPSTSSPNHETLQTPEQMGPEGPNYMAGLPSPSTFPIPGTSLRAERNVHSQETEDLSALPTRSGRSRRTEASDGNSVPTVMFYPSTTTVSSLESIPEPMPFFKSSPDMRFSQISNSSQLPVQDEARNLRRQTTSTVSSGVLGVADDFKPVNESDSDEETNSSMTSSFEQLVRTVSTIRRGQPRIIRNPSRRNLVPEVSHCSVPIII